MITRIVVCTTPGCVRASKELSKHMDPKINPCDDFYQFACGNFLKTANLDNQGSWSVQNVAEDEILLEIRDILEGPGRPDDPRALMTARRFYRACMNERALQVEGKRTLMRIFSQMGGWPTLDDSKLRKDEFDWTKAAYDLRRMGINSDFFFGVSIVRDITDKTRHILAIHDVLYSPPQISNNLRDAYLDYMTDVAVYLGASAFTARRDAEEVLKLLLKLAKISEASATFNKTRAYKRLSLLDLHEAFRTIPWYQYLKNQLEPVENITLQDMVLVTEPLYLRRLETVLEDTSGRVLANFIAWHTIQNLINYLPAELVNRAYEYLAIVNGRRNKPPRWKICVKTTEQRMESVISTAYINNFFDQNIQNKVLELIGNIKMQFKYNLFALDWLDQETKDILMHKLVSSTEETVSYDDLIDALAETRVFDDVAIYEDKLLESALNLGYVGMNLKFSKLRKPFKENWLLNNSFVTGVNIHYSQKENLFRYPVGIFRGLYYQPDRPDYMNYAILGSVIAHEISHIFMEAQYRDMPGDLRSWWSPTSLVLYDAKLQCLANQYGKFEVTEVNKHLDPLNTRDEDVADLAGMRVSYDAYAEKVQEVGTEPRLPGLNYSPNQLFWISSAVHHCSKYSAPTLERYIANYQWSPQQYRVNGPLQNIKDFALDFGCPAGSKMNPDVKCEVW
ncbi:hypothetical protein NQ318_006938 [Aromia moschata]|uniref:Uncharacterized protein n=1 Tax=Aromia moschata TaxID=1265417 RepID=A0AAV8YLE0_9CUCU|nr:hypothetical protein NQ318_006938 [Aromia moschata]